MNKENYAAKLPQNAALITGQFTYYVDKEGNVWSAKSQGFYRLKPFYPTKNTVYVSIAGQHVSVQSLVAAAFLPAPAPFQTYLLHLDGNKLNNAAANLTWATKEEYQAKKLEDNANSAAPISSSPLETKAKAVETAVIPNLTAFVFPFSPTKKYSELTAAEKTAVDPYLKDTEFTKSYDSNPFFRTAPPEYDAICKKFSNCKQEKVDYGAAMGICLIQNGKEVPLTKNDFYILNYRNLASFI